MLRKALLLKLFGAACMQRWNDKIRPVDLTELDKQAHKMILAWFVGRSEGAPVDWIALIEAGLFEFLQRAVLTDLKPPIFYKIKADPDKYARLNAWVREQLRPVLSPLGSGFTARFREHFESDESTLHRRILGAAHISATRWEFDLLNRTHPEGYEMVKIGKRLELAQQAFADLKGVQRLQEDAASKQFIDLCGQLRFQIRWANLHRNPRTSVLGHSLFVALLAYLFSVEVGACRARAVNNFFTGLFHDLPEVLTRDIISPVKRSVEGLDVLIRDYEKEMMDQEVYSLLPRELHPEMRLYTEGEFESIVVIDGARVQVTSDAIGSRYNEDRFAPRDGELVKASDRLAAFIEAYMGIRNGSGSPELHEALWAIRGEEVQRPVAGIDLGEIYADFD